MVVGLGGSGHLGRGYSCWHRGGPSFPGIEGPLKALSGLGIPGGRSLGQGNFGEGAGTVVGLGQWSRREEGKEGQGRAVERRVLG